MNSTVEEKKTWKYESDRVLLCPYIPGSAMFAPDILARLWAMMERDKLMATVFPGMGEMTFNRFISYMSQVPLLIGLVKPMRGAPETLKCDIAGFAFLYGVEGSGDYRKAMCAFAFTRPNWRMAEIRQLTRLGLRWWFEELGIAVLFGTILASNGIALSYAKKMGFTKVARVPNFFCRPDGFDDAYLVTLTRERFNITIGGGR